MAVKMLKTIKVFLTLILAIACLGASAGSYTSLLNTKIETLVNAQRAQYGLKSLKHSKTLSSIAYLHSADMVKRNYTAHVNPDGLDPSARAKRAGYNIVKKEGNTVRTGVGENIYEYQAGVEENGKTSYYLLKTGELAKKAVDGWMSSPGHRKNILNPDYTFFGTGTAVSKDKKAKITQVFF